MEFLQPILLWGLLGLSIPVAIHLWNGKKGSQISWAAMAWLVEKENQSSKSIRLDQLFLLFLRLLMLVLLVLMLAKLIWKDWPMKQDYQTIHLVAPEKQIFEEFRFELEEAQKFGENVYWLLPGKQELTEDPIDSDVSFLNIQKALNEIEGPIEVLHIYLPNSQNYVSDQKIVSPVEPIIHLGASSNKSSKEFLVSLDSGYVLKKSENGRLAAFASEEIKDEKSISAKSSLLTHFIDLKESDQQAIKAALASISEVMKITIVEVANADSANLIFSNALIKENDPDKLAFVLNQQEFEQVNQVKVIPENLNFENSEQVKKGQLPEYFMREIAMFFGFEPNDAKISLAQLEQHFIVNPKKGDGEKSQLVILLMGLFLLTFSVERYWSNKKGL
ncbi:BatA domain-containing protein [Algoriphagus machipongonensis]|uniref:Membrane protein n=1 Tax=Algoriphagus machipongonensis TaxID=388413 RepID=A3I1N7_9BACT|nr:BatA domain-containing protein [Algoriphagus machipongonensis]EAZ79703.1 membrane protein [Algoriphagus machipongonensis]